MEKLEIKDTNLIITYRNCEVCNELNLKHDITCPKCGANLEVVGTPTRDWQIKFEN